MENVYKHTHSQKGLYEVDMSRGISAFNKWTIITNNCIYKMHRTGNVRSSELLSHTGKKVNQCNHVGEKHSI